MEQQFFIYFLTFAAICCSSVSSVEQETLLQLGRYCYFPSEKKTTAINCYVDRHPSKMKEKIMNCSKGIEGVETRSKVWVDVFSVCGVPPAVPTISEGVFECLYNKDHSPEGTTYRDFIREYGEDKLYRILADCIELVEADGI